MWILKNIFSKLCKCSQAHDYEIKKTIFLC